MPIPQPLQDLFDAYEAAVDEYQLLQAKLNDGSLQSLVTVNVEPTDPQNPLSVRVAAAVTAAVQRAQQDLFRQVLARAEGVVRESRKALVAKLTGLLGRLS